MTMCLRPGVAGRFALAAALALVLLGPACHLPDKTPPRVLATYPADGASDIPLNARLQVVFSEPMDEASAEAAFLVTSPSGGGTFGWHQDTMFFFGDERLQPMTRYTLAIADSARDQAGNSMAAPESVSFLTGDSSRILTRVAMMGRSVMQGWFRHWEEDPWQPFYHDRFVLDYHELMGPPDIAQSAAAIVESLPADQKTVFFKLCFVDFSGGDSASAQENLDRNLGYVRQVYDTVVTARGMSLILGNALPQVSAHTDPWLVWDHRQYNQRLLDFAAQNTGVRVFDLYSVLSESDGTLKSGFATSGDDSHPNAAGYAALDGPFFTFLNQY